MNNLPKHNKIRVFEAFAGYGGASFGLKRSGLKYKVVGMSEFDPFASALLAANFPGIKNWGDITKINPEKLPDFDLFTGGFPCQPFSSAGLQNGEEDKYGRGTLFYDIFRILKEKCPKYVLLENVKGLKNHMHGETFETLLNVLQNDLCYETRTLVLNAKYFGVPQNRERLFFVCWDKSQIDVEDFRFPLGLNKDLTPIFRKEELDNCIPTKVSDIFEPKETLPEKMTISDKMWAGHKARKERNKLNGKGFGYSMFNDDSPYCSTISARYWKDGSEILIDQSEIGKNPRRLTPVEAGRLQGYKIIGNGWEDNNAAKNQNNKDSLPEMHIVVSSKEAYHQFGNSVAVPVVRTLATEIYNQLLTHVTESE